MVTGVITWVVTVAVTGAGSCLAVASAVLTSSSPLTCPTVTKNDELMIFYQKQDIPSPRPTFVGRRGQVRARRRPQALTKPSPAETANGPHRHCHRQRHQYGNQP